MRLPIEERMLKELLADPKLKATAEQTLQRGGFEAERRRMLASGLRVTERIIPSVVKSVNVVRQMLHIEQEPEIYVIDEPHQNASCMKFGDGRISILFSAPLLERMGPQELMFVIGHELGHVLFDHHAMPSSAMLHQQGAVGPKDALKLLSWSRAGEISCDRVGLLCCQNLESAATSLIKLSSGLKEPLLQFHLEDYLGQMKEIQSLADTVDDAGDWFSTHPFSPLRVVALNHFWESQPLDEILGHGQGKLSSADLEKRIEGLLASMDPDAAEKKSPEAAAALLWGGYWVAVADGTIDDAEIASIKSIGTAELADKIEKEVRGFADPLRAIKERFREFGKKCARLPQSERYALIQKLVIVARSDGRLDAAETAVLRDVCRILKINPGFVDQCLMATD